MHNNGFTLIEVLAVIIVLLLISLVSFPSIIKTIKNNQEEAYNTKVNDIILAAKSYNSVNNVSEVPVSVLLSNGYLNTKMIDPRDNTEMNGCVHIANGDYTYTKDTCLLQ